MTAEMHPFDLSPHTLALNLKIKHSWRQICANSKLCETRVVQHISAVSRHLRFSLHFPDYNFSSRKIAYSIDANNVRKKDDGK